MPQRVVYKSLSRVQLVKAAIDMRNERNTLRNERDALRDERDALKEERDMLRRTVWNDMRRFCNVAVPDFRPLGGNRPDCAVASGAAVFLSASSFFDEIKQKENPLPPDVYACTTGILCAPVVIDDGSTFDHMRLVCKRRGPARTLSAQLSITKHEGGIVSDRSLRYDEIIASNGAHAVHWPWALADDADHNNYQMVALKIQMPQDMVKTEESFFKEVPRVKSVDLSSTQLTTLGNNFFDKNPHLAEICLPKTITSIGERFLAQDRDISRQTTAPNGCIRSLDLRDLTVLEVLGDSFMEHSASLTELQLPASITRIDGCFLCNCPKIESMDLRHLTGLTSLGGTFMSRCGRLTELHLPPSVTEIDYLFLSSCASIKSIDLRELTGLKSLVWSFLAKCSSLTEVHLPASVTQIGNGILSECPKIESIDLRHLTGLTSLRHFFMASCDSLTEVHLPTSITQIDAAFLRGCRGIKSIDLRHLTGLTSLGQLFMGWCDSLTEVYLPASITRIEPDSLCKCPKLKCIDLPPLDSSG